MGMYQETSVPEWGGEQAEYGGGEESTMVLNIKVLKKRLEASTLE